VTVGNNGRWNQSGAGYGIKLKSADRDRYFDRTWTDVAVGIEGLGSADVKLSASFWAHYRELRSIHISTWMRANGFASWPNGNPPSFQLRRHGGRRFKLSLIDAA
jgi:hypothetical protein